MSSWKDEQSLESRAQAASFMLPWHQAAQALADDLGLELWELEDLPDEALMPFVRQKGLSPQQWVDELPDTSGIPREALIAAFESLRVEEWFIENVRRAVREEEPLPFGLIVGGAYPDTSDPNWPVIWGVITPMSDPEAVTDQMLRFSRKFQGKAPSKEVSQHLTHGQERPFTPEQMVAMHERGMSYREIAIQSLRGVHPRVIGEPERYKKQINTERERVIKTIRAAQELWNSRMPEDSIG